MNLSLSLQCPNLYPHRSGLLDIEPGLASVNRELLGGPKQVRLNITYGGEQSAESPCIANPLQGCLLRETALRLSETYSPAPRTISSLAASGRLALAALKAKRAELESRVSASDTDPVLVDKSRLLDAKPVSVSANQAALPAERTKKSELNTEVLEGGLAVLFICSIAGVALMGFWSVVMSLIAQPAPLAGAPAALPAPVPLVRVLRDQRLPRLLPGK